MCLASGKVCEARWWHSIIYLIIGVLILSCYIALSITFYIECYSLEKVSLYPIQCGSNAMWSCMGWVPTFFFIIIIILTFMYLLKQSLIPMKVISSSRAWLILFVTIACCVLFFIHICYLAYICNELLNNDGCDEDNPLADANAGDGQKTFVDCTYAIDLIGGLLFCAISLIIFICVSLTLIFAMVNGRIATPVQYETVRKLKGEDIENGRSNSMEEYDEKKDIEAEQERTRQRV